MAQAEVDRDLAYRMTWARALRRGIASAERRLVHRPGMTISETAITIPKLEIMRIRRAVKTIY